MSPVLVDCTRNHGSDISDWLSSTTKEFPIIRLDHIAHGFVSNLFAWSSVPERSYKAICIASILAALIRLSDFTGCVRCTMHQMNASNGVTQEDITELFWSSGNFGYSACHIFRCDRVGACSVFAQMGHLQLIFIFPHHD